MVEPKRGENIGAAARAMKNFGLAELRLVSPVDGWPNERARAVAARAADVIDAAKVYGSLEDAVADVEVLYATTGRTRGATLHSRQVMCHELAADLPVGNKVGRLLHCCCAALLHCCRDSALAQHSKALAGQSQLQSCCC
jgi:tRNA/rRNA methyltransferase